MRGQLALSSRLVIHRDKIIEFSQEKYVTSQADRKVQPCAMTDLRSVFYIDWRKETSISRPVLNGGVTEQVQGQVKGRHPVRQRLQVLSVEHLYVVSAFCMLIFKSRTHWTRGSNRTSRIQTWNFFNPQRHSWMKPNECQRIPLKRNIFRDLIARTFLDKVPGKWNIFAKIITTFSCMSALMNKN